MEIILEKKVLLYWKFTAAVIFAAVFLTVAFCLQRFFVLRLTVLSFCTGIFLLIFCFYLPKRFKTTRLAVLKSHIYCKKGVIIKREYYYPNLQIQYIQRLGLPVAACFGLTVPIIRGTGHSLVLPAMSYDKWLNFKTAVDSGGK